MEHPHWQATDLGSLRAISTGSTLVPQGFVDAVQARGVPVLQVYGATETSPIAVYTRLGGDLTRPLSTGLPGLLCEARVVDDAGQEVPAGIAGEVEVRGPNVLTEYWRDDSARPQRHCTMAGSAPATSQSATLTATSVSTTARRT